VGPIDQPQLRAAAARALVGAAPLVSRWIERLLAGHEPALTTPQYLALRAIETEPISVNELARRAGVSGSAATQILNVLVGAGYVERRVATGDRRRQELILTGAGAEVLASLDSALVAGVQRLIEDLPKPEIDALAIGLPFVEAALSGAEPPRRPKPPHGPPR
jgi:DNA-binding MarR family transcriptional regulator